MRYQACVWHLHAQDCKEEFKKDNPLVNLVPSSF